MPIGVSGVAAAAKTFDQAHRLIVGAAGLYIAGFVSLLLWPDALSSFELVSPFSTHFPYWYSFVTYIPLHASLGHVLKILILTAMPILILRGRLRTIDMLVCALGGGVIGGVVFALIPNSSAMIGGGLASWGLLTPLFATGSQDWAIVSSWVAGAVFAYFRTSERNISLAVA